MGVIQGQRVSALRKEFLVDEDYATNGFYTSEKYFEITETKEGKTTPPQRNENLLEHLITEDSGLRLVSSTPKVFAAINENDFNEDFYLSEEELDSYVDGFVEAIKAKADNIFTGLIDSGTNQVDLVDSALDDIDIKLSLYRSFKSLYNKWVSNSEVSGNLASGYFFNNYGQNDNRTLFDHFKFINRANQDIGGIAVVDVSYLSNLSSTKNGQGPTQTLYQSLTNLLSKNNFDFWPLPSNTDLSTSSQSDEDIKDIFRPLDFYTEKPVGPTFNCVYVGGSTRAVNDIGGDEEYSCSTEKTNFEYKPDSFDLTEETDWPEEFKKENEGLIVFKVKYGSESQNHFSSIELDQAEFRETQESLIIIDTLTNPEKGSSPSQIGKGNSIFNLYLTRSYNCKVTGLGNMSIQPLMYFKLENTPMFRGTYLIKDVKHTITAHNIKTEFTGMRQNRVTVPLVTDALSILDLTLSNVALDDETTSLTASFGSGSVTPSDLGGLSEFNDSTIAGFVDPRKGKKFVDGLDSEQKNNIKIIVEKLKEKGITQPFALAAVLAICSKESSLIAKSERFTYSAKRLTEVFPSKFPTEQSAIDGGFVNPNTKKADNETYQKKIANQMYGGRYGNNENPKGISDLSDDGWNYRGNGFNQLTFKGSYIKQKENSGVDILANPYLLNQPEPAARVVAAFMEKRIRSLQSSGKISAYGATGANDFSDITNAVLAYYHCNTGTGKSVAEIKSKLTGNLGGMKKAQERAPFLLEYIKTNGLV